MAEQASAPTAVDDAEDLRGFHFRRLLGKRVTLIAGGVPTLMAAIALALVNPLLIPVVLLLGLFVTMLVVFFIASRRAADTFFEAYAKERGMTLFGRGPVPPATPLLRKGDDRYVERTLEGLLGHGIEGAISLYTYEDEHTDSDGNRQTSYYHYTIGVCEVADCARFVPQLICQRKFGFKALEGVEDAFRTSKRVELESEALEDRYEIFAGKEQDANWLRQLFSPTFIVWLTESAPKKFAFEVIDGALCCYVSGHKSSAKELDAMREATAVVAARLRDESRE